MAIPYKEAQNAHSFGMIIAMTPAQLTWIGS